MVGQPLQIDHLHPARGEQPQHFGLGGAGIAIQHHDGCGNFGLVQGLHHQRPIGLVTARHHIDPPADLRKDRGEGIGPLPPAPAIDQRTPAAVLFGQRPLEMPRRIAGNQRRPQLARGEGADLLVDRAHPGALFVIQHRQADRAGQMILGPFRRRANIDDLVKAEPRQIAEGCEGNRHWPGLAQAARAGKGQPSTEVPSTVTATPSSASAPKARARSGLPPRAARRQAIAACSA